MAFKMNGWSAFTKNTDMGDIKVTPKMQEERDEYNILSKKLSEQCFLEDNDAKRYDKLSKIKNQRTVEEESAYGSLGYEARD